MSQMTREVTWGKTCIMSPHIHSGSVIVSLLGMYWYRWTSLDFRSGPQCKRARQRTMLHIVVTGQVEKEKPNKNRNKEWEKRRWKQGKKKEQK